MSEAPVTDPAGVTRSGVPEAPATASEFGALLLLLLLQPTITNGAVVDRTARASAPGGVALADDSGLGSARRTTALETEPEFPDARGADSADDERDPHARVTKADASMTLPGILPATALLGSSECTDPSDAELPRPRPTAAAPEGALLGTRTAPDTVSPEAPGHPRPTVTTGDRPSSAVASTVTPDEAEVAAATVDPRVTPARPPATSRPPAHPDSEPQPSSAGPEIRARGAEISKLAGGPVTPETTLRELESNTRVPVTLPPMILARPRPAVDPSEAPGAGIPLVASATSGEARPDRVVPARAPEPVLAPSEPPVVEQVVRAARVVLRDGLTQLEVRLEPPSLGPVRVTAAAGADGLGLTIAAERPETRALLAQVIPEMQAALAGHGITAPSIAVATSFEPPAERRTPPRRDGERPSRDARPVADRPRSTRASRSTGAVDLTI